MEREATTFGEFLVEKRKQKGISGRHLAKALNVSPVYMCDMEKGRKACVTKEFIENVKRVFLLDEEETNRMHDLIAIARNSVSIDLPEYIMSNELVRTALRTAKKNNTPDEKWEKFIKEIIREE